MPSYNNLPISTKDTEVLLWENPAPTSNLTGGSYLTALSNPQEYDKFRVVWQMSSQGDGNEVQIDYKKLSTQNSMSGGNWSWGIAESIVNGDGSTYTRRIATHDTTQFWISTCQKNGASGTNPSYLIPLRIIGLKENF